MDHPWRVHPVLRAGLYLALLLGAFGAAAILLNVSLALFGVTRVPTEPSLESPEAVRLGVVTYGALTLAAVLATCAMTALVEKRPFRTVGFQWNGRATEEIGLGLLLGVTLQTGIVALAWLLGWAALGEGIAPTTSAALAALAWGALLFVPAALLEELTVRGYLLPTLAEAWGVKVSLVVTSLLFGALHMVNPGASALGLAGTAIAGILLGLAYLWTGRLWLPWALHAAWNWAQGSLWGLPVSGARVPAAVPVELRGPALWSGGAFGPEAGLLGLLAVGVGIMALVVWRGRRAPDRDSDGISDATAGEFRQE